ncbi:MAG: DUF664 domain-containing protein [Dermatophilaceae bacterium]
MVWFGEAVTGPTPARVGVPSAPARSSVLNKTDTIASVQARTARSICAASRQAAQASICTRRSHLQVLREVAQHAGHADILREQVIAARQGCARG